MTWEEVLADRSLEDLPYKIELNRWGNIEMRPLTIRRGMFKGKIGSLLHGRMPDGVLYTGCSIQTAENVKVADVAWISYARYDAAAAPDEHYPDTAPEICVEVVCPGDAPEELMHKGSLYLGAGSEEFWLCNELGDVRFFDAGGPLEHSRLCSDFPIRAVLD